MTKPIDYAEGPDRVRIDKWLWAARVRVRKGPYEYQLVVRVAGDRRGSATEAAKL